ncbi:MAG: hypothetical protein K2K07_10645 [Lachnospiraceae bacterium]|nr:hypothetical protein [Lachnospiraceae bacterium]
MKKVLSMLLMAAMVLSLTACGDSFKQGMKDAMGDTVQEEETQESETAAEPQQETEPDKEEPEEIAAVIEYDDLQKVFLTLGADKKPDDLETLIDEFGLKYTVEEYNSSSGKTITYQLAYTEGAALQKYKESGDYLEISFGGDNQDEFRYAQYVNEKAISYTALLYDHGTWYDFGDNNAEDYSGYYINDSFSGKSGITVKYSNGNEVKTNYLPCNSGEEAIQKVVERISEAE